MQKLFESVHGQGDSMGHAWCCVPQAKAGEQRQQQASDLEALNSNLTAKLDQTTADLKQALADSQVGNPVTNNYMQ